MKKFNLLLTAILFAASGAFAQAPQSFKYQAVARDANGDVVESTLVGIQISILQGSVSGPSVYTETFTPTTNDFGLINLEIGSGILVSGDFTTIDWDADTYFVKVEMDITGGTTYEEFGTSQLLSVPYAFHSKTVETETDPVFGLSVASGITETDTTNWNNKLDAEVDGSVSNELQTLSLSNDTLNISSGNSVILTDADPANELQTLSLSGDTLFINNGNYIIIPGISNIHSEPNFEFTCGGIWTDTRDGQTYTTVQIGSQCWMAENLNIGTRIDGVNDQTDNAIIEKYCYDDNESNCALYGGLYQWDEMMQYITTEGTQGVCPVGWHIPTDADWCLLENFVDATTDPGCNLTGWRGTDAGTKLKQGGSSGFEALMTGERDTDGLFYWSGAGTSLWSSTESGSDAWRRYLSTTWPMVARYIGDKLKGYSVRCVKD